jgi:hypothetical protein
MARSVEFLFMMAFIFVIEVVDAQTVPVVGTVKDEKGSPIGSASVVVEGQKTGTTTDSLGIFNISISPKTMLIITAVGYLPDTLQTVSENRLSVVLKRSVNSLNQVVVRSQGQTNNSDPAEVQRNQSMGATLNDFAYYQHLFTGTVVSSGNSPGQVIVSMTRTPNQQTYTGSFLPVFSHKEDTKGTRYLFERWVGGIVLDTGNNIIDNKGNYFNYDKVSRGLLLTQDFKSVIEVNKDQVKAFDLKDESGKNYIFEQVAGINNGNFVQQLVNGQKYRLYKSINTKFVKENHVSDGMTESGNPYDEYVNEYQYYLVLPGGKDFKKLVLKKKAIKETLNMEAAKVNSYFSQHGDDEINEDFLIGLTLFINQ